MNILFGVKKNNKLGFFWCRYMTATWYKECVVCCSNLKCRKVAHSVCASWINLIIKRCIVSMPFRWCIWKQGCQFQISNSSWSFCAMWHALSSSFANISAHSRRHLIQPPALNVPLVELGLGGCGNTTAVQIAYQFWMDNFVMPFTIKSLQFLL